MNNVIHFPEQKSRWKSDAIEVRLETSVIYVDFKKRKVVSIEDHNNYTSEVIRDNSKSDRVKTINSRIAA